jgi:hypothetical protein
MDRPIFFESKRGVKGIFFIQETFLSFLPCGKIPRFLLSFPITNNEGVEESEQRQE